MPRPCGCIAARSPTFPTSTSPSSIPTTDEIAKGRDGVKAQLLNQQRQRFFGSYMSKARERMTIRSNPAVLAQVIG